MKAHIGINILLLLDCLSNGSKMSDALRGSPLNNTTISVVAAHECGSTV